MWYNECATYQYCDVCGALRQHGDPCRLNEGHNPKGPKRNPMKAKIHPNFYPEAQVICACGNTFTTGSTRKTLKVDVCSNCHPFYTGQQRLLDTTGRVDRFRKRFNLKDEL